MHLNTCCVFKPLNPGSMNQFLTFYTCMVILFSFGGFCNFPFGISTLKVSDIVK